jgi:hypothetical protein
MADYRARMLRLRAEEMRALAETFGLPSARRTLLNVALDYERRAETIERASPIGSSDTQNAPARASENACHHPGGR